jgi:hypothetical protein
MLGGSIDSTPLAILVNDIIIAVAEKFHGTRVHLGIA